MMNYFWYTSLDMDPNVAELNYIKVNKERRRKPNLHPWVKVDQAIRPLPLKHLAFW